MKDKIVGKKPGNIANLLCYRPHPLFSAARPVATYTRATTWLCVWDLYVWYVYKYLYICKQAGRQLRDKYEHTPERSHICFVRSKGQFALCRCTKRYRVVSFFYETFKIFTSPSRLDSKELRHGQINYKKHVHKCLSVEKEKSGHKLLRVFESTKCLKCNLSKYKLVKCIKKFLGCRNASSKILALIIAKLKVISIFYLHNLIAKTMSTSWRWLDGWGIHSSFCRAQVFFCFKNTLWEIYY